MIFGKAEMNKKTQEPEQNTDMGNNGTTKEKRSNARFESTKTTDKSGIHIKVRPEIRERISRSRGKSRK